MHGRSRYLAVAAAAVALLIVAPSASAGVTIGQVSPPNPPLTCTTGNVEMIAGSNSVGPFYFVPAGGRRIRSWSTMAAAGDGQTLKMKVFRPLGAFNYLVVAHDGPQPLVPGQLNTFPVSIPVQAGDLVGLNDANATAVPNACTFETPNPGDIFNDNFGDVPDGQIASLTPDGNMQRPNVSAEVQFEPNLSSIGPDSGSFKGGTKVTISGSDFSGATSVRFGSAEAKSFNVDSDGKVSAVAPHLAGKPSGPQTPVHIVVTTPTGETGTGSADTFTYDTCVVPKLKGKSLRKDKKKLKKGGCKLGKVKGDRSGRTRKQSRKPGSALAPGSKVNVTLG